MDDVNNDPLSGCNITGTTQSICITPDLGGDERPSSLPEIPTMHHTLVKACNVLDGAPILICSSGEEVDRKDIANVLMPLIMLPQHMKEIYKEEKNTKKQQHFPYDGWLGFMSNVMLIAWAEHNQKWRYLNGGINTDTDFRGIVHEIGASKYNPVAVDAIVATMLKYSESFGSSWSSKSYHTIKASWDASVQSVSPPTEQKGPENNNEEMNTNETDRPTNELLNGTLVECLTALLLVVGKLYPPKTKAEKFTLDRASIWHKNRQPKNKPNYLKFIRGIIRVDTYKGEAASNHVYYIPAYYWSDIQAFRAFLYRDATSTIICQSHAKHIRTIMNLPSPRWDPDAKALPVDGKGVDCVTPLDVEQKLLPWILLFMDITLRTTTSRKEWKKWRMEIVKGRKVLAGIHECPCCSMYPLLHTSHHRGDGALSNGMGPLIGVCGFFPIPDIGAVMRGGTIFKNIHVPLNTGQQRRHNNGNPMAIHHIDASRQSKEDVWTTTFENGEWTYPTFESLSQTSVARDLVDIVMGGHRYRSKPFIEMMQDYKYEDLVSSRSIFSRFYHFISTGFEWVDYNTRKHIMIKRNAIFELPKVVEICLDALLEWAEMCKGRFVGDGFRNITTDSIINRITKAGPIMQTLIEEMGYVMEDIQEGRSFYEGLFERGMHNITGLTRGAEFPIPAGSIGDGMKQMNVYTVIPRDINNVIKYCMNIARSLVCRVIIAWRVTALRVNLQLDSTLDGMTRPTIIRLFNKGDGENTKLENITKHMQLIDPTPHQDTKSLTMNGLLPRAQDIWDDIGIQLVEKVLKCCLSGNRVFQMRSQDLKVIISLIVDSGMYPTRLEDALRTVDERADQCIKNNETIGAEYTRFMGAIYINILNIVDAALNSALQTIRHVQELTKDGMYNLFDPAQKRRGAASRAGKNNNSKRKAPRSKMIDNMIDYGDLLPRKSILMKTCTLNMEDLEEGKLTVMGNLFKGACFMLLSPVVQCAEQIASNRHQQQSITRTVIIMQMMAMMCINVMDEPDDDISQHWINSLPPTCRDVFRKMLPAITTPSTPHRFWHKDYSGINIKLIRQLEIAKKKKPASPNSYVTYHRSPHTQAPSKKNNKQKNKTNTTGALSLPNSLTGPLSCDIGSDSKAVNIDKTVIEDQEKERKTRMYRIKKRRKKDKASQKKKTKKKTKQIKGNKTPKKATTKKKRKRISAPTESQTTTDITLTSNKRLRVACI